MMDNNYNDGEMKQDNGQPNEEERLIKIKN